MSTDQQRIATAVRLPTDLHERLHAEASTRMVSVNLLVTWAVRRFLDALPPVEQVPVPSDVTMAPTKAKRPPPVVLVPDEEPIDLVPAKPLRPRPDPEPIKLDCKHPRDQRTPYGVCKACKRKIQP